MKDRPILFAGPMVRALLADVKTQTRRAIKNAYRHHVPALGCDLDCIRDRDGAPSRLDIAPRNWELCPYGVPGDLLWVREAFANLGALYPGYEPTYIPREGWPNKSPATVIDRWKPGIHMPRAASRLTLRITDVRVQRLQGIDEQDAKAEGAAFTCPQCGNDIDNEQGAEVHAACDKDTGSYREGFRRIWTSINGLSSWNANPYVWALTFEVIKQNVDLYLTTQKEAA